MTTQMIICLVLFVGMVAGYVLYKPLNLPMGVTALIVSLLACYTGLVEPKVFLSNFANKNVIMIISMFVVAAGFNRTQAVKKLSGLVYKISGGSFTKMLAGYLCVAALLSQFIPSPMTVFGITFPLTMAMCDTAKVSPSKAMFPLGLVAIGTCGTFPTGPGAVAFATNNGYLESYGYAQYQFGVLDVFKARFPAMIVILLFAIFIAPKLAPAQPPVAITASRQSAKGGKELAPLDPVREFLGYFIFAATTLGLIFQGNLGVDTWQIALTGAVAVTATGVLSAKEAIAAFPIRVVLMLVGALTIGGAMADCGLGDLIGATIADLMGGTTNGYIIGGVFFLLPFLLTQVMQNQSVSNIFIPIVILSCKALECNPIGPLILCNAACVTAFLTPMATGTVPMIMEAGGYDLKSLLKMGWLPSLIICVVSVLWTMTVFPAY